MAKPNRSIFRSDAIRHYAQRCEETVLPRFVSPSTFTCLWILLGLLVISGIALCFAEVPVYASGQAVVVNGWDTRGPDLPDDIVVVAFLPPESLPRLRVGQALLLHFDSASQPLSRSIITFEPQLNSPAAVQRRFVLNGSSGLALAQPVAVVIADFKPVPTGLPADTYVGSVYRVDVQVGSRRLLSLLPLIGHSTGE